MPALKKKTNADKPMNYIYLAIAIVAEVIATSTIKSSNEFTKLIPSIVIIIGYGLSLYLLALSLRSIPVGITYATWSGLGIVLVTISGIVFYKQVPDLPAIFGMILIVSGVIIMNLFSKTIVQ